MFENLGGKLQEVFKNLKGKGALTEKDVKEAMREVRVALLEADVNFTIVKDFIKKITEKATGEELFKGLNPAQNVIKIVNEELTEMLGTVEAKLTFSPKSPTVYMLVGLQGAGKTTTAGKLAAKLRKQNKKPLLVACDIYRPAAVKQLEVVGSSYNIPVFKKEGASPPEIAKEAIEFAVLENLDVVIIDTAGRLHIDEDLMQELENVKKAVPVQEILLVVDAMIGQEAVNIAKAFNESLGIDGVIMTKLDSDARGGALLSIRAVTGTPIKYLGMGEKLEELQPFYPDRMANRILGMGDVLSLIEKASEIVNEDEAKELEKKMRSNEFSLEDFLAQMQQIKKMGPIKNLLGMIPGISSAGVDLDKDVNENALVHIEAIIYSMTKKERRDPSIINGSRKKRIAKGSGRSIQEVNKLLKQFEEMKKMMKMMTSNKKKMSLFGR